MADLPAIQLSLAINNEIIPTYPAADPLSKYIHFYPSTNFALHLYIPATFSFLADVLIMNVSINSTSIITYHIRPGAENKAIEGIIRSPALIFPPEPHDHGQIVARVWHARVFHNEMSDPNQICSPAAQLFERQLDSVVEAPSQNTTALTITPVALPRRQRNLITFKWGFRSLDALREIVPSVRVQRGPVWTAEDEAYYRSQLGGSLGNVTNGAEDLMRERWRAAENAAATTDGVGGDFDCRQMVGEESREFCDRSDGNKSGRVWG